MTTNTNPSKVLASLMPEQDVNNGSHSIRQSISIFVLDVARSSIKKHLPFLLEIPRNMVESFHHECKCYPHIVCEDWVMDIDFIRERILDPEWENYEAVATHINNLIKDGPIGVHCLWSDGQLCVKGDC